MSRVGHLSLHGEVYTPQCLISLCIAIGVGSRSAEALVDGSHSFMEPAYRSGLLLGQNIIIRIILYPVVRWLQRILLITTIIFCVHFAVSL